MLDLDEVRYQLQDADRSTHGGKIPGVRAGGYASPRAGLNVVTNRKNLVPAWNQTQVSSPQPSHSKD